MAAANRLQDVLRAVMNSRTGTPAADLAAVLFPAFAPLTDVERTAGVASVNSAYLPGNIRRYGAKIDGVTNDIAAVNTAIAVAIAGLGFVYFPAGICILNGTVTASSFNGISFYGDAAAISTMGVHNINNSVLVFDGGASGTDGLVATLFVGVTIKNLVISMRRGSAGGGFALRLDGGHDFEIDNVKIDVAVGTTTSGGVPTSGGVALGNGTGATSVFLGNLRNVKCMSDGAPAFVSGNTNTSIVLQSCYGIGGHYVFIGNTYVSAISCACDGATSYAYNIIGNGVGMSFTTCGAEIAGKGAYYLNNAHNVCLTAPFGSSNNTSASTNTGSLVQIDSAGGACTNITIINPTDTSPNAATTASIYGTAGNGIVHVIDANANYLFGTSVGGDPTWMFNYLTIEGDSNVEVIPFTPTLGSGWTNVGTAVVTGHYVKKGKFITINIVVTPGTSIQSASLARINIPWTPTFNGSATQIDGNNGSYGAATVAAAQLFCQATGVLTVPLYFQGSFYIA